MAVHAASRRSDLGALLLLLGGVALFIGMAVFDYRNLRAVESATRLRAESRETLLQARSLLSAIKDVETGQRGFLITGLEDYLQPYRDGKAEAALVFARYRELLPAQVRIRQPPDDLWAEIEARIALADRNIQVRQRAGFDAARARVLSQDGKRVMDALRTRFAVIDDLLRQEIAYQNRRVETLRSRGTYAATGMTGVGVGLILFAFARLLREQRRREEAEQALADINLGLEAAVASRTRELEQARTEIEDYVRRLDSDVETERRRLAREVHDQVGQVFTALKMTLAHGFACAGDEALARANQLISEGITTARRISAALRPPLLDDMGLGAALSHFTQGLCPLAGIVCHVRLRDDTRLDAAQALQLFRIAQEALTNALRHARARTVQIDGEVLGTDYRLVIVDDGCGLTGGRPDAQGIVNMRERAQLAGGHFSLESGESGGVRIVVDVPLVKEGKIV